MISEFRLSGNKASSDIEMKYPQMWSVERGKCTFIEYTRVFIQNWLNFTRIGTRWSCDNNNKDENIKPNVNNILADSLMFLIFFPVTALKVSIKTFIKWTFSNKNYLIIITQPPSSIEHFDNSNVFTIVGFSNNL